MQIDKLYDKNIVSSISSKPRFVISIIIYIS